MHFIKRNVWLTGVLTSTAFSYNMLSVPLYHMFSSPSSIKLFKKNIALNAQQKHMNDEGICSTNKKNYTIMSQTTTSSFHGSYSGITRLIDDLSSKKSFIDTNSNYL